MDRSITQALHGLIPTISGPLPPQLVDLASSLLAQSRSRASSLRAEEEIARSYACANIACERLKKNLSLPKIEPRPPCPPRVYRKLYDYLDSVVPVGVSKNTKFPKRSEPESTPVTKPHRTVPPLDNNSHTKIAYHPSVTSRRKAPRISATPEIPVWTMPVIRRLCRKLGTPGAPHHVFAGVSSIFTFIQADGSSSVQHDIKIPALIIAIYFFTTARLIGVEIKSEQLVHQMTEALTLMKEIAEQGIDLEVVTEMEVRTHMRQVALQKWVEMDWFRNIKLGSGIGANKDEEEVVSIHSASESDEQDVILPGRKSSKMSLEKSGKQYLQPGLGTMMQERVDYLSDEHNRDFQEWKTDIMLRIREMQSKPEAQVHAGTI